MCYISNHSFINDWLILQFSFRNTKRPGTVVHTFSPSTQESRGRGISVECHANLVYKSAPDSQVYIKNKCPAVSGSAQR